MQNPVYADNTSIIGDGTQDNPLSATGGGGSGNPGGTDTAVQFNNAGSFGGDAAAFSWDDTAKQLEIISAAGGVAVATGPTESNEFAIVPTEINLSSGETGSTISINTNDGDIDIDTNTGSINIVTQGDPGTVEIAAQNSGGDACTLTIGSDSFTLQLSGDVIQGINNSGTDELGFFAATPISKPVVTGSRASGAALTSLLSRLAALGLITDSTTT